MNANEMNKHYNNTAKMHLQTNDPIQEKDGEASSDCSLVTETDLNSNISGD